MTDIGFAIVGAGSAGRAHAQAIEEIPGARVVVVSNRTPERGQHLAADCQADWEQDWQTAVRRDDVDVVNICTANGVHMEIAVEAAAAGKHLIVEKPLDVTLERADQIIESAQRAGIRMTCIFQSRFADGVRRTKQALEAGRLGRLVLASASVKWNRSAEYYSTAWRGTWAIEGGAALINQAIHSIDVLQWLAGPVETICGHIATQIHPIEAEDTGSAVLRFKSGAQGAIQASTAVWPGDAARIELHGEKGTIILEESRIVRWKLADASQIEEDEALALGGIPSGGSADPTGFGHELHRRQIVDFIESLKTGRSSLVDEGEGRKALEIVLAIYRSSQTGAPVRLPL
jgi:predicted dehydrogenase